MVDTGASPAEEWQADSGKTDKGPVVLTVLVVLALVASIAMLFTNSPVVMKLATLAALWAAFLGVFLSARYRRSWAHEKSRAAEAKLAHAAELTHEQELHREQELLMEQNYADALREQQDRVLSQITSELEQMRQTLESLTGREWVYEPADVHVEARRRAELASTGTVDVEQPEPEADHSAEQSPAHPSKPTAQPASTKPAQAGPTSTTDDKDDSKQSNGNKAGKETTSVVSDSQDTSQPDSWSFASTVNPSSTSPVDPSQPAYTSTPGDTKDDCPKQVPSAPRKQAARKTEAERPRGRHGARGEHETPRQVEKNPTPASNDSSRGKASTPGRHEPHPNESMTASGSRVTTSSFAAVNWAQGGTRTEQGGLSGTPDAPDASSGRRHREASSEREDGKLTVAQLLARNKAAANRDDAPRGHRRAEDHPRGRHSSKDTGKKS